jgi:hypothetical protein
MPRQQPHGDRDELKITHRVTSHTKETTTHFNTNTHVRSGNVSTSERKRQRRHECSEEIPATST